MATKSLREYLDEYGEAHRHVGTRVTHMFGIPMIVGSLPMFPLNPIAAGGLFVGGWILQFIGHYVFEKNDPKVVGDPVNLLIGVVWAAKEGLDLVGVRLPLPTN